MLCGINRVGVPPQDVQRDELLPTLLFVRRCSSGRDENLVPAPIAAVAAICATVAAGGLRCGGDGPIENQACGHDRHPEGQEFETSDCGLSLAQLPAHAAAASLASARAVTFGILRQEVGPVWRQEPQGSNLLPNRLLRGPQPVVLTVSRLVWSLGTETAWSLGADTCLGHAVLGFDSVLTWRAAPRRKLSCLSMRGLYCFAVIVGPGGCVDHGGGQGFTGQRGIREVVKVQSCCRAVRGLRAERAHSTYT